MKNYIKIFVTLIILFICVLALNSYSYAASSTKFSITVDEDYNYANKMLKSVNEERKKDGKSALKIDSNLTKIAMQRAAELVLYYSHTRPNGGGLVSIKELKKHKHIGENISTVYSPAAKFTEDNIFKETDVNKIAMNAFMNSTGHRANILSKKYKSIGIGCVYYKGGYYWAQIFASGKGNNKKGKGLKSVDRTISVLNEFLDLYSFNNEVYEDEKNPNGFRLKILNLNIGTEGFNEALLNNSDLKFSLSSKDIYVTSNGVIFPSEKTLEKIKNSKGSTPVSGTATIKITTKNGKNTIKQKIRYNFSHLYTKKVEKAASLKNDGIATYTCDYCNNSVTSHISKINSILLNKKSYKYNKKAIKPEITILDNDGKKIDSSNYSLSYSNNKKVGTAKIKIKFKGVYTGTITKKFKITK